MRQGITTKYQGPTNTKGARVRAVARNAKVWSDGSRDPAMAHTDHWDHSSGPDKNHTRVAHLLAVKLGWSGLWVGGGKPGDDGYQYVCAGAVSPGRIGEAGMEELGREGVDWFDVPHQPREDRA